MHRDNRARQLPWHTSTGEDLGLALPNDGLFVYGTQPNTDTILVRWHRNKRRNRVHVTTVREGIVQLMLAGNEGQPFLNEIKMEQIEKYLLIYGFCLHMIAHLYWVY